MINNTLDVVWGTNGIIWIQRRLPTIDEYETANSGASSMIIDDAGTPSGKGERSEIEELIRQEHANTPPDIEIRQSIARLRNSIECLRLVHCLVTPENVEQIYTQSEILNMKPSDMLLPNNIIQLTELSRK